MPIFPETERSTGAFGLRLDGLRAEFLEDSRAGGQFSSVLERPNGATVWHAMGDFFHHRQRHTLIAKCDP